MRVFNDPLFTNIVLSANRTSSPIPLKSIFGFSVQANYTATPTGTFKLQVSTYPVQEGTTDIPQPPSNDWVDLANSSFPISSSGSYIWNVSDVQFTWVRLVYTDGSSGASTSVVNARINSKGM